MKDKHRVIVGLRVICGLTIVVGLVGFVAGLFAAGGIPLFGVLVPGWVLGASVAYMGARYWRRLPEMERKVELGGSFAWSNFRRGR